MKLIHLNPNVENCLRISKMPKKWVEKKSKKFVKKCWKLVFLLNFYVFFDDFQHFLKKFSNFISNHFFGIFELPWQSSQFWLRWNNFLCSKWLSYRRFTKSILPSSQVENVTAYHPSTIYTSLWEVNIKLISIFPCNVIISGSFYH